MSRALDNLGRVVESTAKTSANVVIPKDQIIDLIDSELGELYNVSQFFTSIEPNAAKLQSWMVANQKSTNLRSMAVYGHMINALTGSAKSAMTGRFLGAMVDTVNALIIILEEISGNIDKLFVDKNITVYNTRLSQVAIIGMITNGKDFSKFCTHYISLLMSDRNDRLDKPERYVTNFINTHLDMACSLMNRVLNKKLSKTFTSAIVKYRNGGADTNVINSDNKATVQFGRINTELTEDDVAAGSRGFKIFRILGNWRPDRRDKKHRRRVAEREQLQARARLLQLELEGLDPESPEYQRLLKIIANYQKQIDRLSQEIAKYEEED